MLGTLSCNVNLGIDIRYVLFRIVCRWNIYIYILKAYWYFTLVDNLYKSHADMSYILGESILIIVKVKIIYMYISNMRQAQPV